MKTLYYIIIAMCVAMIFGGHSAFAQYGCPPVAGGWDPKIVTSGNHGSYAADGIIGRECGNETGMAGYIIAGRTVALLHQCHDRLAE